MKKLKPAWKEILQRLSDGNTLYYGQGIRTSGHFFWKSHTDHKVSWSTVEAMQNRGLINAKQDDERFWRVNYFITIVGRAALDCGEYVEMKP